METSAPPIRVKRPIVPHAGDRLRLRALEERDLSLTLSWRNRDEVRCWFNFSGALTPEMHRQWWEKYRALDNDFVFVIEDTQKTLVPVGQVSVYHVAWTKGEAEYGRCVVAPEATGRNVLFRASQALFDVARQQLRLERLHLQVKAGNAKARHIYEKLGFAVARTEDGQVYMDRRL